MVSSNPDAATVISDQGSSVRNGGMVYSLPCQSLQRQLTYREEGSTLVSSYHMIEESWLVGGNWQMSKLGEKMGVVKKNHQYIL